MLIKPPPLTQDEQHPLPHPEPKRYTNRASSLFVVTALLSLCGALVYGSIGGLQYIFPEWVNGYLPFYKTRPLHVSLAIAWIFLMAIGGLYTYSAEASKRKLYSEKLAMVHWWFFVVTGVIILGCYFAGVFGGREYFEFPPVLLIPIGFSWFFLIWNFFATAGKHITRGPVYLWMWTTGVVFFIISFTEQYLWLIPYFRDNIIRDLTVQWNSNGAMVGSWNMLVYGTAFYLMEKISGEEKIARSNITFFFYFLGLTNLMFNWGHHTYIVPAAPWVKYTAYIISMTELLILGNIIWNWRKTVSDARKNFDRIPYNFMIASDVWIFLNLALAILISIPNINYYTHGTHITVAHAMGATIGINTTILMASAYYYFIHYRNFRVDGNRRSINWGFWLTNISLFIFWVSLIVAGYLKGQELNPSGKGNFADVMKKIQPWLDSFSLAGFGVMIGLLMLVFPLLKNFWQRKSAESFMNGQEVEDNLVVESSNVAGSVKREM